MNQVIESCVAGLNEMGGGFCDYAGAMLVQSGLLVVLLLIVDAVIRKRVRATVRYWLWILVFAKLLLPPTLSLPTGIGSWGPEAVTMQVPALEPMATDTVRREPAPSLTPGATTTSALSPTVEPSDPMPEMIVPAPAVVAASTQLTWQAGCLLLWIAGVLIFGVIVIQRVFFVRGLMAQSGPAEAGLLDVLASCLRRIGVRRDIAVRVSPQAFSPAVCGLFRPTILVPSAVLEKLSVDDLRAVLIHEVAHIKRGDLWLHSAQTLLQIVYFYNPFVWLANARVRGIRERAVDETVLVALGAEAGSYSRTLIDIAEMTFFRANPALRLIGVAESRKSLEGRIKHMMTRPIPKTAKIGLAGFLAVLIAAAVLLPMARGQRMDETSVAKGEQEDLALAETSTEDKDARRDHHVSATALTSLERTFVAQVLDQVRLVEEAYPKQATHWPTGPTLYHVDGQGKVTVWRYQLLRGRQKDCADDEVGWGSSRLVNAEAMYYLPDGTPLLSRWRERGGGMKDIRVKVGRVVKKGEQLPLIHRHRLPSSQDMWSRDGRERRIQINNLFGSLPLSIIVRVDRPMRRCSWWVGDATTDSQHFDDYDQLLVTGPPHEDRGPMLVGIEVPVEDALRQEILELVDSPATLEARAVSGTRLMDLSRAMWVYADDHDDRFPDRMADAVDCYPINLSWLQEHVAYLGKGQTMAARPDAVLAYDKTMLAKGQGALVLFGDGHVGFATVKELEKHGIRPVSGASRDTRIESARQLSELGKALMIYVNDFDRYPATLQDAQHFTLVGDLPWLLENVEYLGKGMPIRAEPDRVVAYDKTLLAKEAGTKGPSTNVLSVDGRVSFEEIRRLRRFGIMIPSR